MRRLLDALLVSLAAAAALGGWVTAQFGVEQVASQRDRVRRQLGVFGPGHRDGVLAVHHPHPLESVPPERDRIDAETVELAQRTRGQCVTARLVARHRPLHVPDEVRQHERAGGHLE